VRIDLKKALTDALGISGPDLVSIVGAGGKTSLMYRLGQELASSGRRTLLTTTTRILYPGRREIPVLVGPEDDSTSARISKEFSRTNLLLAGRQRADSKLLGFDPEFIEKVRSDNNDLTVVAECDGARGKSLKVPEEHEPPVANSTSVYVVVIGADCLHRPLDSDAVYNPERVAAVAGVAVDATVSEPVVTASVLSQGSYLGRKPSGARLCVFFNKVDTDGFGRNCFRGGGSVLSIGMALKTHGEVERVVLGSLAARSSDSFVVMR
jgi:probable selenium-dependent hydroxylase accessory protein YqeC